MFYYTFAFYIVYYDCYVLYVLEIGQRATELTSPVFCYTEEDKNYLSTSIAVYMTFIRANRLLIN